MLGESFRKLRRSLGKDIATWAFVFETTPSGIDLWG